MGRLKVGGSNPMNPLIVLNLTSVFTVKMANHYGNHRSNVEKNAPIAFILPNRWQYGAEILRICL